MIPYAPKAEARLRGVVFLLRFVTLIAVVASWSCRPDLKLSSQEIRAQLDRTGYSDAHNVRQAALAGDSLINMLLAGLQLPADTAFDPDHSVFRAAKQWLEDIVRESPQARFIILETPGEGRLLAVMVKHYNRIFPLQDHPLPSSAVAGLFKLNLFLERNSAIPRAWVSAPTVQRSLQHPESSAEVRQTLAADAAGQVTELGGIATISEPTSAAPRLHLYPIPSASEPLTRRLHQTEDDPEGALALIRERQADFLLMQDELKVFLREIEHYHDPATRQLRIRQFLDQYLLMARLSYFPAKANYNELLMSAAVEGYIIGGFHVHPHDNEPSLEDKAQSWLGRNLVITPITDGFKLYYVFYGEGAAQEPVVMEQHFTTVGLPTVGK